MFWSDETDPCCSQKLAQIRSIDGVAWQDEKNTVASDTHKDRPGMAVVSRLQGGIYFMTYELCGPAACTVFSRTSPDGWNFGPPSYTGKKIETAGGAYFEHAPRNLWIHTPTNDGTLLVVGQILYENGNVSPQSGHVLFVNHTTDGSGTWEMIPGPVKVDVSAVPYKTCQNYSSALLPSKTDQLCSKWRPIGMRSIFARPIMRASRRRLPFQDRLVRETVPGK
jgi:hypothetical protein